MAHDVAKNILQQAQRLEAQGKTAVLLYSYEGNAVALQRQGSVVEATLLTYSSSTYRFHAAEAQKLHLHISTSGNVSEQSLHGFRLALDRFIGIDVAPVAMGLLSRERLAALLSGQLVEEWRAVVEDGEEDGFFQLYFPDIEDIALSAVGCALLTE